jgi:hypothetical protein
MPFVSASIQASDVSERLNRTKNLELNSRNDHKSRDDSMSIWTRKDSKNGTSDSNDDFDDNARN